jgi:hypothetical protein
MKYVVIAVIAIIAFTAVANNIDPASRPFVDIAMGALVLWICFMAGVKMDAWLHRLEHRPRRVRRPSRWLLVRARASERDGVLS